MAKGMYSISLIREGRDKDYYDFWERGITKNSFGEELHSDLVCLTVDIEAKNLNEAISIAKNMHPELTVVRKYSSKIGWTKGDAR
jgi:hypothetical protein